MDLNEKKQNLENAIEKFTKLSDDESNYNLFENIINALIALYRSLYTINNQSL